MTSQEDRQPKGGQLRDEAAEWFAVMRGPDAGARRAEFEAWLARGALHRSAYNRIAEAFSLGKGLKNPAPQPGRDDAAGGKPASPRRPRLLLMLVLLGLALSGAVLVGFFTFAHVGNPAFGIENHDLADNGPLQLTTRIGEIRSFKLPDGSSATLDTDSLVLVSYTHSERILRLERGRGRFEVAHEQRSFVVKAGNGSVTARGTIFDVGLEKGDRVLVRLLRGAIDVDMPLTAGTVPSTRTAHLSPGEQIAFGPQNSGPTTASAVPDGNDWPEGIKEFDQARLIDLVAEANRYATTPIAIASADVGAIRVSGTFKLRDTRRLVANLADLLRLSVTADVDRIILSRHCPTGVKNCPPPS